MAETPPTASPPDAQSQQRAKQPPLLEPGDFAQYLLHTRNEILFVLRSLLENASQITVFFNEGKDLLLTMLIGIEEDSVLLDLGASAETNRKALTVEKLFCVASLDKVRIQFLLRGLSEAIYEGRPAFRAKLPTDLLRLQRREFFRLTMPITRPLKCQIPVPEEGSSEEMMVEMNIVDLSGGGLAIALPDGIDFAVGKEFKNCRVELPEVGVINATLCVRNQFEITLRSGGRVRRAGCEFIKLPGPMLTLVQRYIIKIERERKARESGMM